MHVLRAEVGTAMDAHPLRRCCRLSTGWEECVDCLAPQLPWQGEAIEFGGRDTAQERLGSARENRDPQHLQVGERTVVRDVDRPARTLPLARAQLPADLLVSQCIANLPPSQHRRLLGKQLHDISSLTLRYGEAHVTHSADVRARRPGADTILWTREPMGNRGPDRAGRRPIGLEQVKLDARCSNRSTPTTRTVRRDRVRERR